MVPTRYEPPDPYARITALEAEIARLVAEGKALLKQLRHARNRGEDEDEDATPSVGNWPANALV
jgi:hypothetical protein